MRVALRWLAWAEIGTLHFEGMSVVLRLAGETRFVLDDVGGFMSVWRRDTPGVRVTLGQVKGTFTKPEVFGNTTKIGDGAIDAELDYYQRPEKKARLRLDPETGSGANLTAIGTNVRSWFSDKLEVTVE